MTCALTLYRFDPARTDLPPEWTAAADPGALAPEERELMAAKSPCNVLNADLPDGPGGRVRFHHWLTQGLLKAQAPSCWLMEATGGEGQTLMLLAGLPLQSLRPLERTAEAGVAKVQARLLARGAVDQPVLALAPGLAAYLEPLAAGVRDSSPALTLDLGDGRGFALWPVDAGPPETQALVVDGHQRLETLRRVAPRAAVFTALADPDQVVLRPFHRVVTWHRKEDWEAALAAAEEFFKVTPADRPGDEGLWLGLPSGLWRLQPRGQWAGLPVPLLADDVFLGRVLGWSASEREDGQRLELTTAAGQALQAVAGGGGQAALLVGLAPAGRLLAWSGQGLLPPRSVSASPRPPSGLLYHLLTA